MDNAKLIRVMDRILEILEEERIGHLDKLFVLEAIRVFVIMDAIRILKERGVRRDEAAEKMMEQIEDPD